MVQEEKLVTPFGTVTPGRVICCVGRGWLSGGSRQDVPLCCVTGVVLQTRRHPVAGILPAARGAGLPGHGPRGDPGRGGPAGAGCPVPVGVAVGAGEHR